MKNIILSIGKVEPGLVTAAKRIETELGRKLQGIHLVDTKFKQTPDYGADNTGFFEEIVCDFDNPSELQNALIPIQQNILAVNCRMETAIQDYIKAVPYLPDTPTPTESSLRWATEKSLMREKLQEYNPELVPKFSVIERNQISLVKEITVDMEYPLIVKPSGLNSSILVTKCENQDELFTSLEKTFKVIEEIYERERGSGRPQVLIEEFIEGDMYSTDAYISPEGKIWCLPPVRVITSHDVGFPGFYGYEFQLPTELNGEDLQALKNAAEQSVKALDLRSCTAHIELYNCKGNWKIIELGPRIGGHREDLYREAYEIDHYYNDLASRIEGLSPVIPEHPKQYAICMDLYPEKEGYIESFNGMEEARKLPTCVFVDPHTNIGVPFFSAENGSPYAASAIFSGPDKKQVTKDAARARELIKIITKPF